MSSTLSRPIRSAFVPLLVAVAGATPLPAQTGGEFHRHAAELVARGSQALALCNGVFLSARTPAQIYDGELRAAEGDALPLERVEIDHDRKTVAVGVGSDDGAPVMRAAHREGLGCVVLSPDQTFDDVDELPELRVPPPPGDPARIPWPDGDLIEDKPFPEHVNRDALEAAGEWTFDRVGNGGHAGQVTLSLLVVHRGDILLERYAPEVDASTRTRTWSTAKSIASTLIGIAAGRGLLDLDAPLPIEWVPDELNEMHYRMRSRMPLISIETWPPVDYQLAPDPRRQITLRHVLNMSSGLYPVDNEYGHVIGSRLSYFGGWSSADGARDRGLVREPGTVWDYENYDTLLGVLALRAALGDRQTYLEFPRRALFDKIGMRSTVPGVDRFGDFVMSSQVYTNARDLARLGLLYLNRGMWNGERVLPEEWVDFVRTPAAATLAFGGFYGGGWWIVPDARTDIPQDAYTTAGARGQFAVVIPSYDLVVVRRGLDGSGPGFPTWDMVAEILKALPNWEGGRKFVTETEDDPPTPR